MRLRLVVLVVGLWLLLPNLVRADEVYTLSVDYSSVLGIANSTVQWQFDVPSILTTPTTITSFLSASLGSGLSGCGGVSDAQIPLPSQFNPPYTDLVITDFTSFCGSGNDIGGAGTQFIQSITSEGVFDGYSHNGNLLVGTLTIAPVPEPSAMFLLSTGLLGLVGFALLKSRFSQNRSMGGWQRE
jgi:hypothetical protein